MRAIVVRHYKTLLNASDRILGWGDAPRVEGWRADVQYVENRFREQSLHFDAIYSSDLERARQTAMFYARRNGIHIVYDSHQLNEVNYGSLYGKSKKWVAKHIPQHKKDPDYVYPEGESFRQMQRRSVDFVLSLTASHPGQTLLFVVHAGVIRGLISHFLGLNYAENLKQKISHRYIGQFDFEGGECRRYDELGQQSGFVKTGTIQLPFRRCASPLPQQNAASELYL
jgi:probable phosphoglycerate mutase